MHKAGRDMRIQPVCYCEGMNGTHVIRLTWKGFQVGKRIHLHHNNNKTLKR